MPPATSFKMKKVPPEGDVVDGKFIPGGTRIAHSNWTLMHDKAIFGLDAEMFRPERWIEASQEKKPEMENVVHLGFGYGRWMRLGKTVAFMELNKVYVEVRAEEDDYFPLSLLIFVTAFSQFRIPDYASYKSREDCKPWCNFVEQLLGHGQKQRARSLHELMSSSS